MARRIRSRRNADAPAQRETMKQEWKTETDGISCTVTVSDEREALLAAQAAGGAIIGIWDPESGREEAFPPGCLYLVPSIRDATPALLERAARRHLDLPLEIARTARLTIREFAAADPLEPESAWDGDGVFSDREKREAYRRNQYRFFECGLWALVHTESGRLIGKAGITGGELGYHIYPPFRRQGYAREACRAILQYAWEELNCPEIGLWVDSENIPSQALARALGFSPDGCPGGTLREGEPAGCPGIRFANPDGARGNDRADTGCVYWRIRRPGGPAADGEEI